MLALAAAEDEPETREDGISVIPVCKISSSRLGPSMSLFCHSREVGTIQEEEFDAQAGMEAKWWYNMPCLAGQARARQKVQIPSLTMHRELTTSAVTSIAALGLRRGQHGSE